MSTVFLYVYLCSQAAVISETCKAQMKKVQEFQTIEECQEAGNKLSPLHKNLQYFCLPVKIKRTLPI